MFSVVIDHFSLICSLKPALDPLVGHSNGKNSPSQWNIEEESTILYLMHCQECLLIFPTAFCPPVPPCNLWKEKFTRTCTFQMKKSGSPAEWPGNIKAISNHPEIWRTLLCKAQFWRLRFTGLCNIQLGPCTKSIYYFLHCEGTWEIRKPLNGPRVWPTGPTWVWTQRMCSPVKPAKCTNPKINHTLANYNKLVSRDYGKC